MLFKWHDLYSYIFIFIYKYIYIYIYVFIDTSTQTINKGACIIMPDPFLSTNRASVLDLSLRSLTAQKLVYSKVSPKITRQPLYTIHAGNKSPSQPGTSHSEPWCFQVPNSSISCVICCIQNTLAPIFTVTPFCSDINNCMYMTLFSMGLPCLSAR